MFWGNFLMLLGSLPLWKLKKNVKKKFWSLLEKFLRTPMPFTIHYLSTLTLILGRWVDANSRDFNNPKHKNSLRLFYLTLDKLGSLVFFSEIEWKQFYNIFFPIKNEILFIYFQARFAEVTKTRQWKTPHIFGH